MKRIKLLLIVLFVIIFITPLSANMSHISVPLNHRVYSILRIAEIRGLINSVMEVRPFSTSKVLTYLDTIKASNKLSNDEMDIIDELIAEFTTVQPDNSFKSLAKYGSYHTYFETLDTDATMGFLSSIKYAQSLNDLLKFDSRNSLQLYIRTDVKNIVSFNMNIGLTYDHLDYNLFLKNDFNIPIKGKYEKFWNLNEEHTFYVGFLAEPEVSISLLNNSLSIRWASIKRDWGVGENNFMLAKDANSINGIELNYEVTPWLRYAFIAGALGKFTGGGSLFKIPETEEERTQEYFYYKEYFPSDYLRDDLYNNNFSAHRVEISLPFNIKFGIYESVVYRKRFELGYLNPLSILMFEQDIIGDFDNMLAGIDLQYTLKDYFRVYVNAATTEMNEINPLRYFRAPRNILSIQTGTDVKLPFLSFSSATLQYTYLAPFFYTHKPMFAGDKMIGDISMVNAGRNIGYPLRPNSDEILAKANLNFRNGWDGYFIFKYQRRSGQYGFSMGKYMLYTAANNKAYEDKDFSSNIFEKTIGIEATVNKAFKNYPFNFSLSYMVNLNNVREKEPQRKTVWSGGNKPAEGLEDDYIKYPVTKYEVSGPWKGWTFSHSIRLGINIWH